MRYTRYDIRKKNKRSILPIIGILILATAFIIGSLISNYLIKDSKALKEASKTNTQVNQETESVNKGKDNDCLIFETVQCGIFNNKDNIAAEKNILQDYGACFTIDDTVGTRVFLGIYPQANADTISKTLTDKGIENVKASFRIDKSNLCDAEIAEIINANLQVLNRLSEKNVKTIKTDDLKKWISTLKTVDKNSKNYKTLTDLINYTNSLQSELSKEKISDCYIKLYNTLKVVSVSSS